jgi:phage head maturation protease
LLTEVKVSRTETGDETLELANDDALSASVGFMVNDPRRDQQLDRYTKTRRINRAFLDHLAFVGVPAYGGAKVMSVRGEPDLPAVETPGIDDILDDPIFQWANNRIR